MTFWPFAGNWGKAALLLAGGLAAAELEPLPLALGGPTECEVPDELMQIDEKLPHLAERLHANEPVKIVAIGGASTTGLAAGSSDLAYPHRLQEILSRWYPSAPITVANRGVPRQTAQQMLERFPTDVIPEDPVLVIWETGTTDAVRGVGVDDFASTLQTGVDELKAHGIDIMLVDMQFSHSTVTVIDFERYLNTLHRVGDVNDINVLSRFEMMRYWSEQNVFNFDGIAKDERADLAAKVYDCIAKKLAEAIRIALR
jgi:acyl-CoA thioesterase I